MSAKSALAATTLSSVDPIWTEVRKEAEAMATREPALASLVWETVLNHRSLEEAVIHRIAGRLDHGTVKGALIGQTFHEALAADPAIGAAIRADIQAVYDRDPACERYLEPLLYFKGFHAIETQRLSHWLWRRGRRDFALYLQSRCSAIFQVDVHPQVPMGRGVFFDHGTGIVVGMTAVIEDDVSILQGVTLGGTGKEVGDRHPKVRHGVLIGAGASVLGNIEIGAGSRVAAGSVVLHPVPCGKTVAGVPAKIVGEAPCKDPGRAMDQMLDIIPDYLFHDPGI